MRSTNGECVAFTDGFSVPRAGCSPITTKISLFTYTLFYTLCSISNDQDIERMQRFFFTDDEQGEPELISSDTACLAIKQFLKEQTAHSGQAPSAFPTQSPEDDGDDHNHSQVSEKMCAVEKLSFALHHKESCVLPFKSQRNSAAARCSDVCYNVRIYTPRQPTFGNCAQISSLRRLIVCGALLRLP